jgi:hypothetical protein
MSSKMERLMKSAERKMETEIAKDVKCTVGHIDQKTRTAEAVTAFREATANYGADVERIRLRDLARQERMRQKLDAANKNNSC